MNKTFCFVLAILLFGSSLVSAMYSDGLVAEWKLNTNATTVVDTKGVRNGTLYGSVSATSLTGIGNGLAFPGQDTAYINITDTNAFGCKGNITFVSVFKPTNINYRGVIFHKYLTTSLRTFLQEVGATSFPYTRLSNNGSNTFGLQTNSTVGTGTYTYITTWDNVSLTVKTFMNGSETTNYSLTTANLNMTGNVFSESATVQIGGYQATAGRGFNGTIAQVSVWCRQFNNTEPQEATNYLFTGHSLSELSNSTPDAVPNISITATDEDQNISAAVITGLSTANVTLTSDPTPDGNYRYSFYFNVSHAGNKTVNITLTNVQSGLIYDVAPPYLPVWTCDGTNWYYVNGSQNRTGTLFSFWVNQTCDNIQMASIYPMPYTKMRTWTTTKDLSSYVSIVFLANTTSGNQIQLLRITDDASPTTELDKVHYFIMSGQHGNSESYGIHICKGLVDFTINTTDPIASLIRNNTVIYAACMMNPDNFISGLSKTDNQGRDWNDNWSTNTIQAQTQLKSYIALINNTFQFDFFWDFHGSGGAGLSDDHINSYNLATLGATKYNRSQTLFYFVDHIMSQWRDGPGGIAGVNSKDYFWQRTATPGWTVEEVQANSSRYTLESLSNTGKNFSIALLNFTQYFYNTTTIPPPQTMWINQSHPSCSDSYTRTQATDLNTPWCTDKSITIDKIQSADTVYLASGIYTDKMKIRNKAGNVSVSGGPGQNVILARADLNFYYHNTTWTNVTTSGSTHSTWTADFESSYDCVVGLMNNSYQQLYPACSAYTYCNNSICSPSPSMTITWWNTTLPYDSLWFDNANQKVYLKLNNQSLNPNTISMWIGEADSTQPIVQIDNVTGPTSRIGNMTFISFDGGIYFTGFANNFSIQQSRFVGGHRTIQISGESANITIQGNTAEYNRREEWTWTNEHDIERDFIWGESAKEGIKILNNNITGWTNAIVPRYLSSYGLPINDFNKLEIAYNTITHITDDVFEPEDYANCYNIHHNNVTDAHVVLTLTPSNSTLCMSNFTDNIGIANLSISSGSTRRVFKISGCSVSGETGGWYIARNSLKGDDAIIQSAACSHAFTNFIWKDNLFYGNTGEVLFQRTGTVSDNVTWDYNLYYDTSNRFATYWANDTDSREFATLGLAKAGGSYYDGWDGHSVYADPQFVAGYLMKPAYGNPACTLSSTGSYVGAVPCSSEVPVAPQFKMSVFNKLIIRGMLNIR
jgi:hypothetical protein